MKIKPYTLYQVPPRWLFLKIETDAGIRRWRMKDITGETHSGDMKAELWPNGNNVFPVSL